jgi:hypothetical protein
VKLTAGRVPVLEITLIRSGISLVVSAGEGRTVQVRGWAKECLKPTNDFSGLKQTLIRSGISLVISAVQVRAGPRGLFKAHV